MTDSIREGETPAEQLGRSLALPSINPKVTEHERVPADALKTTRLPLRGSRRRLSRFVDAA